MKYLVNNQDKEDHEKENSAVKALTEGEMQTDVAKKGFPHRLENLEKWTNFFQSGKSQGILCRLEKSGKFGQNTGKVREI